MRNLNNLLNKITVSETYKIVFENYPDVVSVEQMSEMLQISTKTAYKLLRENKIEHFRFGKKIVIPKLRIMNYLKMISDEMA